MAQQSPIPSPHCHVTRVFALSENRELVISSQFDSGNIEIVRQISDYQYRLSSVFDNQKSPYKANAKSWFHFSVQAPVGSKCKFIIQKVQCLYQIIQSSLGNVYRPVVKEEGKWKRLETECRLGIQGDQIVEIAFEYEFKEPKVFFAFCFPWSYEENIAYLRRMQGHRNQKEFYYHSQILIHSPQQREVHLLTITSHSQSTNQFEVRFSDHLFPDRDRPLRFNKPAVLISGRVHPGQTPASHCMNGIINFLSSPDLRALILREMFVFMVIPMINVDGVYRGNFRMDVFGQNLNRYYIDPDVQKQGAAFAIKKLAEHLNSEGRLSFYFDLHAHNAKKGCFIYGNAIDNFVDQVESNTFCKLVALNTKFFEYNECSFSTRHMKIKDKFQDLSKEGCARVVMHKLTKIIHSYSLQCGLISSNRLNDLVDCSNQGFRYNQYEPIKDDLEVNSNPLFQSGCPLYTPQMYQNVGKALMVSILDTFDKNPYSRVPQSTYVSLPLLRRFVAFEIFHQAQRFRLFQKNTFLKVKNINSLMVHNFNQKFSQRVLRIQQAQAFTQITWPPNISGLQPQLDSPKKLMLSFNQKYYRIVRKSIKHPKPEDRKEHSLSDSSRSELTSTPIQSNAGLSPLEHTTSQQANLATPQVDIAPDLQQLESLSKKDGLQDLTLKSKVKREIQLKLKAQLSQDLYQFADNTMQSQDAHSELHSNLIFNRDKTNSNIETYSYGRNNASQKMSKTRDVGRPDRVLKSSARLSAMHQNLNKFYRQLHLSIVNEQSTANKFGEIQSHHSEAVMTFTNKMRSAPKDSRTNGDLRKSTKLPRIQVNPKQVPGQASPLNTVELDLVNDQKCQKPQQNCMVGQYISTPVTNALNRLRRIRK